MKTEYKRRVTTFLDRDWVHDYVWSSKYERTGNILNSLDSLNKDQEKDWDVHDKNIRINDTYQWCLALQHCTKYLACDDRYKMETGYASKDDRFKKIYEKHYYFRRRWVAFLRQIQKYVELINDGDWKLYMDVKELHLLNRSSYKGIDLDKKEFEGYVWATIVGHIDAAQLKLDAEDRIKTAGQTAQWWADKRGQTQHIQDLLDELREV
jgi:hypothetical protein